MSSGAGVAIDHVQVRGLRGTHRGMFPCFLGGRGGAFGAQRAQTAGELQTGFVREDHAVHVAALGCNIGVCKLLGVFLDPRCAVRRRDPAAAASSLR